MRGMLRLKARWVFVVGVFIGFAALTRAVMATPPSGVLSGTIIARGLFLVPVDMPPRVPGGRPSTCWFCDKSGRTRYTDVLAAMLTLPTACRLIFHDADR